MVQDITVTIQLQDTQLLKVSDYHNLPNPLFGQSGNQMLLIWNVWSIPFENRTILNHTFNKSRFQISKQCPGLVRSYFHTFLIKF